MPRPARLRFVSLGHLNARFDDLVLDLRDAGAHTIDSTVWLRNGGDKAEARKPKANDVIARSGVRTKRQAGLPPHQMHCPSDQTRTEEPGKFSSLYVLKVPAGRASSRKVFVQANDRIWTQSYIYQCSWRHWRFDGMSAPFTRLNGRWQRSWTKLHLHELIPARPRGTDHCLSSLNSQGRKALSRSAMFASLRDCRIYYG